MIEKTWQDEDLALAAAELVYEASDDEKIFPIRDVPQYRALHDAGYRVEEVFSDPNTGFKAIKLKSDAGGAPIFAVAGLEFSRMTNFEIEAVLNDTEAALGSGARQFLGDRAAEMRAEVGRLAQDSKVIVAGQSLGGRQIQALAYEHAAKLEGDDRNYLSACAFNSIGGEPLVEAVRKEPVDPAIAARANVRGYAVVGDPFAEKHGGRHIRPVRFHADPAPFSSSMMPEEETREPMYCGNSDNHLFPPLRDTPRTYGWGPEGVERGKPHYG